jgi:hypothetical protein
MTSSLDKSYDEVLGEDVTIGSLRAVDGWVATAPHLYGLMVWNSQTIKPSNEMASAQPVLSHI